MAKYIADYLTDIRDVLQDNDTNDQRWTDPELTAHLHHAVMELSTVIPADKITTSLVTVADSREVDISALTDLQGIKYIEYPVDQWPKKKRDIIDFWAGIVTMDMEYAPAEDDEQVNLAYWGSHTVGASTTTVPTHLEWYVIQIAAILAMIGFTRNGRDAINDAVTRISNANIAIGKVADLVSDVQNTTLNDAKNAVGAHNQEAEDRINQMDDPLNTAQDDINSGRQIINDSSADISEAINGSDQRIQKAVEFLETFGQFYINKVNFGNNVPGYYSQYGNTELGASDQYLQHARLLLQRDGASNEWFKAADAGIRIAMAHIQAAQGLLSMNQAGRDLITIAGAELQIAFSYLSEAQGNIASATADLQIAKLIDSYEARARYQLAVVKNDLMRFRPDIRTEINSTV